MITLKYDPVADVLHIRFGDAQIAESDEDAHGNILDYDEHGSIVGMEVLKASGKATSLDTLRVVGPIRVEQIANT